MIEKERNLIITTKKYTQILTKKKKMASVQ